MGIETEGDDVAVLYRDWSRDSLIQRVRIDLFPEAPGLVGPCAMFLLDKGQEKRPGTRENYPKHLKYFSRFTEAYGASYGIEVTEYSDISSEFVAEFLEWLWGQGNVIPRVNDTCGLSYITAAPIYNLVKSFIEYIKGSEEFAHLAPQLIEFDPNPSRKGYRDIQTIPGLPEAHVAAIRRACIAELTITFDQLKKGRSFIEDQRIVVPKLDSRPPAFKQLAVCVKAYHHAESLGITRAELRRRYPGLYRATDGDPYPSHGTVLSHLHFTRRSIVPVVILLQMHLSFEPDTLLNLDWEEEEDSFLYGSSRGKLTGEKYRGGYSKKSKPYVRNDKRSFSPGDLIDMLRLITTASALHIPGKCTRIFCFARMNGSFGTFPISSRFTKGLNQFIKQHELPHFNLSNLRKTGADIIAKVSGGDVAEQKEWLRHRTVATTLKSYQSPSSIARREEQLAHSQNVRVRRVKTAGKIETRDASLPTRQRLAATVGFYCLDPYDSPVAGQYKGELCTAFGLCPTCPLAQVDKSSARDFARLKQVRDRLIEARSIVDPSRWKTRWASVLEALEGVWLPAFTPEVAEAASHLVLPPIPEIE
ncbi:hypothetical protein ACC668_17790 [Rhizobium ruizarguesonis]